MNSISTYHFNEYTHTFHYKFRVQRKNWFQLLTKIYIFFFFFILNWWVYVCEFKVQYNFGLCYPNTGFSYSMRTKSWKINYVQAYNNIYQSHEWIFTFYCFAHFTFDKWTKQRYRWIAFLCESMPLHNFQVQIDSTIYVSLSNVQNSIVRNGNRLHWKANFLWVNGFFL